MAVLIGLPSSIAGLIEFEALPDDYSATQAVPLVADGGAANPAGVGANDVCVDRWKLATPPSDGDLVLNPDGTFIYNPSPNFIGTAAFSYRGVILSPELVSGSAQRWRALHGGYAGVPGGQHGRAAHVLLRGGCRIRRR